ncbi:MAG: tyrosine-type recombinase/integrase [Luteitalea sp.]|nr:tyrosine-type recombinase/integrase [Luteitalea sp.]
MNGRRRSRATFHECVLPRSVDSGTAVRTPTVFGNATRPSRKSGVSRCGLTLAGHPHMLRHACGFALANRGRDTRLIQTYLDHLNISSTVGYTATNPARFQRIWE